MTEPSAAQPPAFSPKVVAILVLVGVFAFAAFTVLSAYAPELRSGRDGGAHALSDSAVGFRGAALLLKDLGAPVVVSRTPAKQQPGTDSALLVLTPPPFGASGLDAFAPRRAMLVVLPKWMVAPDRTHDGWVRRGGLLPRFDPTGLLRPFASATRLRQRAGTESTTLTGAGALFRGVTLRTGPVVRLQTLQGSGWLPVLTDETGAIVLAQSRKRPDVFVLADPDLLNTQGLRDPANARTAVAILDILRLQKRGVIFDVTLHGYEASRSILKLAFEPPILGATLCVLAAAILAGLQAAIRFGAARPVDRALALGKRPLVDNSAGLIRLARKEHEMAGAYVALTETLVERAAGGDRAQPAERRRRLEQLSRARGAESLNALEAAAQAARDRGALLTSARRLYDWRREMTRERR